MAVMDIHEIDRKALSDGHCPGTLANPLCTQALTKDTIDGEVLLWCKWCDVWFEVWDNGVVLRCEDAAYEYNRRWRAMVGITD